MDNEDFSCCSEYKRELLKKNKELEERIYMLERANAAFVHEYRNTRNAALEEAANACMEHDEYCCCSEDCVDEIRKLKEE